MLPVSRRTNLDLADHRTSPRHTVRMSSSGALATVGLEASDLPHDQLLLDVTLLGGQLVHADGPGHGPRGTA